MAKSGNIGHFLLLTRPSNMAVIIFTMLVVKLFVFEAWIGKQLGIEFNLAEHAMYPETFELDFYLLIWSTLLLAAAGNIINDYFDIRADRINRPNKILIGRYVKKRWAIVTHWGFNTTGVLIAGWLSYKYQSVWLVIIPFLSSVILWVYSTYLKRKFAIGNIMIAILTAMVVVLPTHFILNAIGGNYVIVPGHFLSLKPAIFMAGLLTAFAFATNLTREIVKDLHDVPGDLKIGCETIPIVAGARFTRILIGAFIGVQLFFIVVMVMAGYNKLTGSERALTIAFILGIALILCYLLAFIINITAKTREKHQKISDILKIVMLLGILYPLIQLL